jgi:hypothetical protein
LLLLKRIKIILNSMINQDVRIRVAVAAGAVVVDDDGVGGGIDDVLY